MRDVTCWVERPRVHLAGGGEGGTVRMTFRWSVPVLGALGAFAVGCGRSTKSDADASLQRDLKLAATANLDLSTPNQAAKYALVETAPDAKADQGRTLHKGAGPRAIQSNNPTVRATPDSSVALPATLPELKMMSPTFLAAPAPVTAPIPAPAPASVSTSDLPTPVPTRAAEPPEVEGPRGDPAFGRPGVIVRGANPGGDNCGPRIPGGGMGNPIFFPPMMGGGGRGGGAAGPVSGAQPRARGGGG